MGECHLNAIIKRRGIVVIWDKKYWRGELVEDANQVITIKFEGINQSLALFLSAVNAYCNIATRRELW